LLSGVHVYEALDVVGLKVCRATGWSAPMPDTRFSLTPELIYDASAHTIEGPHEILATNVYMKGVRREKHFWSDLYYLTMYFIGYNSIEIEKLTEKRANEIQNNLQEALRMTSQLTDHYEFIEEQARSQGWSAGYDSGKSEALSEARRRYYEEYEDSDGSTRTRLRAYDLGYDSAKEDLAEGLRDELSYEVSRIARDSERESLRRSLRAVKGRLAARLDDKFFLQDSFTRAEVDKVVAYVFTQIELETGLTEET
jgi:hypothetical protein